MKQILKAILSVAALLGAAGGHAGETQVLATVDGQPITADQLEMAITSSPFAVQFNTMDQDDQAALRGSFLQRLISARLLYLEAERLGLQHSEAFRRELEQFHDGLLYRAYMDRLRASIQIPEQVQAQFDQGATGGIDTRQAAESAYRAKRFRALRIEDLKRLREQAQVTVYSDAIRPDAGPDTLLMDGKDLAIHYRDLFLEGESLPDNATWIEDRLYKRAQFLLVVNAAERQGLDVAPRLRQFEQERLPALLLEQKRAEWVADDQVLRAYFEAHPELGRVVERRHIGQLVVATQAEAEALRTRILAGQSLFELAAQHSIDPYGRAHNGDMGWMRAGEGAPAIEQAIAELPDDAVSEVIETPAGFHLITILGRRPGEQRSFAQVRDKVLQAYLSERLVDYVAELNRRFPVHWELVAGRQPPAPATTRTAE